MTKRQRVALVFVVVMVWLLLGGFALPDRAEMHEPVYRFFLPHISGGWKTTDRIGDPQPVGGDGLSNGQDGELAPTCPDSEGLYTEHCQ